MTTSPTTQPSVRPSPVQLLRWGLAAAASGATAGLIISWIPELWRLTTVSGGTEALTAGALVAVAVIGALAAVHLAVVWTLAVLISLAGTRSTAGRIGLRVLRILAPTLARRLSVGVLSASTAFLGTGDPGASDRTDAPIHVPGATVSAPALIDSGAHVTQRGSAQGITRTASSMLTTGRPTDSAPGDRTAQEAASAPEPAAARSGNEPGARPVLAPQSTRAAAARLSPALPAEQSEGEDGSARTTRPPLAWGNDSKAPERTTSGTDAEQQPTAPRDTVRTDPAADEPARTVTVRPGDTLWSITDDLLGEDPDSDARIARHWPLLHEANRPLIGPDPDHIEPGQELTVPHPLSPKEQS